MFGKAHPAHLATTRLLLTCAVWVVNRDDHLLQVVERFGDTSQYFDLHNEGTFAAFAASSTIPVGGVRDIRSAYGAFDALQNGLRTQFQSEEAYPDLEAAVVHGALRDAAMAPSGMFDSQLWFDEGEPMCLRVILGTLGDFYAEGKSWSFWREWYQVFLDGKPLDWELQKEVALIPDAEWRGDRSGLRS